MKILHCIWQMGGGGAERQLTYLMPGLARLGWDVHVAVVFSGVNSERLVGSGCTVHQIKAADKYDPIICFRLLRLALALRPDVIQTWLTQMDIVAGAVALALRIPWLLSERCEGAAYPPSLLHRLRAALGRRAHAIVANSGGGAEYWRQESAVSEPVVIPNIAPLDEIDSAVATSDSRIAGKEIALCAGRMCPQKNHETVIAALPELLARYPRLEAVFCGEGAGRSDLEARVAAAGIADRVVFAGFVPAIAGWMKRASVFIAMSLFEGHPNVVLEAMAAGVPIVASDIPAHRSILGEAGWYVPATDARALATTVAEVLESGGEANRRATIARMSVERLSVEEISKRYDEIYKDVLGRVR